MNKKIFAIIIATLLSTLLLASIPTVTSELIEQPSDDPEDWEIVFQADEVSDDKYATYPDMTIYRIERQHFIGNSWRIRYWIYNTKEFTGTFSDEILLDDDIDEWFIDEKLHNNELMWKGINGPYNTRWFPAPYRGWFDMNVEIDINNDINEGLTGEGNNYDYATALFLWLL